SAPGFGGRPGTNVITRGEVAIVSTQHSDVDESGNDAAVRPAEGSSRFRPDIQGLRALAVSLVILAHAGVAYGAGGFIGVGVFFVISGFVITQSLVDFGPEH